MKQLIKLGGIVLAEGISDGLKSFQMCFFLFELGLSLLDELFGADSILLPESVLRIFLHYSKNNNIQSLYSNKNNRLCRQSSEANSHVLLAHSHSHRPHLEAPRTQTLSVRSQTGRDVLEVGLYVELHVPEPLPDHARPLGDLLVEGILVAQLVPHAGLSSDDVDVGDSRLELVHLPPVLVDSIGVAVEVAEADVEVGEVVVGEDHFVLPACHAVDVGADAPPLDDIFVLHGDIDILVGPVYHLLLGRDRPPELLLSLPEVD